MSRGPGDSFWLKQGVGLYQLKIFFREAKKRERPYASLIEKAPNYRTKQGFEMRESRCVLAHLLLVSALLIT